METKPLLGSEVGLKGEKQAYYAFIILGIGILFPWNVFLSAGDLFIQNYGCASMFFIPIAYNWSGMICLTIGSRLFPRFSFTSRILTAFTLVLFVLITVPFMHKIFSQDVAYALTLILVFVCGFAAGTLSASILGLAAVFPSPEYTGAIMAGNGVAAIITAVLRIITMLAMPDASEVLASSIIYFMLAAAVVVMCIVSYILLTRLPITSYHVDKYNQDTLSRRMRKGTDLQTGEEVSLWTLYPKMWPQSVMVWAVFFVTLSLLPGVTSLVSTDSTNAGMQKWFSIVFLDIFFIGDMIGRAAPKWVMLFSQRSLVIPVVLRFAFFPLLIFCVHPRLISADWAAYIIMFAFAVTNGYCGTLAMIYGPMDAAPHEKEVAGIIMSFSLNFGIFCAVNFALLLLYILTGSIGLNC